MPEPVKLLPATIDRPLTHWHNLTADQRNALAFMADVPDAPTRAADDKTTGVFSSLWQIGAISMVYRSGNTEYYITPRGRAFVATRDNPGAVVCPHCQGVQRGWNSRTEGAYNVTYSYWECPHCDGGIILPEPQATPVPENIMRMIRHMVDVWRYDPAPLTTDDAYVQWFLEHQPRFIPVGIREALEEADLLAPRPAPTIPITDYRTLIRDRKAAALRKHNRAAL